MDKNIGKKISKNLSGKYDQKLLDHAKQSAKYAHQTTLKIVIQKTAKATGDLVIKLLTWQLSFTIIKLQKSQKTHHRIL